MAQPEPFDACWDRVERSEVHRAEAAEVWNRWLDQEPFHVAVDHHGGGRFAVRVVQDLGPPPRLPLLFGEWLYNLRCALDYGIYAAAIHVSGRSRPPGANQLQFPVYDDEAVWRQQLYRLKHLPTSLVEMLEQAQPFRFDDPDASALGWLNRLARIDRHRTLTVLTAQAAEVTPEVAVPEGSEVKDLTVPATRGLVDDEAVLARFRVVPWTAQSSEEHVQVNPRAGIDPEVAEWARSPFWRGLPYNQRLHLVRLSVTATLAAIEFEVRGESLHEEVLTVDFKRAAHARRRARQGGDPSST